MTHFNFSGEEVDLDINDNWEPTLSDDLKRKVAVVADMAMSDFIETVEELLVQKTQLPVELDLEKFEPIYNNVCDLIEENLVDGNI